MAYTGTKEMLLDAQENHYAVGAFNVENMEMVLSVISAAEAEQVPVILQTTPSTLKYAPPAVFAGMVKAAAEEARVPVAMHLDHGTDYELCRKAARAGYTSLMIDGSKLPLEDNIAVVAEVVQMAKEYAPWLCVEAELGRLGGKEDSLEVKAGEDIYTDPAEAELFVARTGVASLAVAIGTAHGFYKGKPKLDFERLEQLKNAVAVPLVLHGSSGVPDEDVQKAISLGVCKVNFATELRSAYTKAVRQTLAGDEALYDPKKFGNPAREAVTALVRHRIRVCCGR